MKKLFFIVLMFIVSLSSVDECMAQNRIGSNSNQSVDSRKKIDNNTWSKENEEPLNKKKKQQQQ